MNGDQLKDIAKDTQKTREYLIESVATITTKMDTVIKQGNKQESRLREIDRHGCPSGDAREVRLSRLEKVVIGLAVMLASVIGVDQIIKLF